MLLRSLLLHLNPRKRNFVLCVLVKRLLTLIQLAGICVCARNAQKNSKENVHFATKLGNISEFTWLDFYYIFLYTKSNLEGLGLTHLSFFKID